MNTHVDKKPESRRQLAASAVAQKQSCVKSHFQLIDNRPETIAQRKLQEIANDSPQAKEVTQLQALADHFTVRGGSSITNISANAPIQFTREWATGKVDKALDKASEKSGHPDIDTGHHKASKSSVMEKVYRVMTGKQWSRAITVLDLESGSGPNALKSLGSNITLGPTSGKRHGEPGQQFDPNVTKSGQLTPRSQYYEKLIEFMNNRETPSEKFTDHEFETVLDILETAEKIHFQKTKGELIDDDISMWEKGEFPEGKNWKRKEAPDYQVDDESLADKSVRDLKASDHKAAVPKKEFVVKMFPKTVITQVTPHTMPLDQDALDRWKADGYTRFYRISDHCWYFLVHDEAKKVFLRNKDFVLDHFPDTPELEKELYGFELLRPKFKE